MDGQLRDGYTDTNGDWSRAVSKEGELTVHTIRYRGEIVSTVKVPPFRKPGVPSRPDREARDRALHELNSSDAAARATAAKTLTTWLKLQPDDSDVLAALTQFMETDADPMGVVRVARALMLCPLASGFEAYLRALRQHPTAVIRRNLIRQATLLLEPDLEARLADHGGATAADCATIAGERRRLLLDALDRIFHETGETSERELAGRALHSGSSGAAEPSSDAGR